MRLGLKTRLLFKRLLVMLIPIALTSVLFLAPVISACTVTIPATVTPIAHVGTTVFSAVTWVSPNRAINVVFVPGTGYGDMSVVANRQVFLNDVANVISNGFYQNNTIALNLSLFNFWYLVPAQNGSVQSPPSGTICPTVTWPNLTDAAFASAIIILHTNVLRDCEGGSIGANRGTATSSQPAVAVHEFSHAALGLPDEYCCDGGYWNIPPIMYSSQSACTSDSANASWRNCQQLGPTTPWWRSEDQNAGLMKTYSPTVTLEYGQADWVVIRNVLTPLPGSVPSTPSVFAPADWTWP